MCAEYGEAGVVVVGTLEGRCKCVLAERVFPRRIVPISEELDQAAANAGGRHRTPGVGC